MIVRTHKEVPKLVVYSAGGGVVMILASIVYFKALMVPTVTLSCSQTYEGGIRFGYSRASGEPLTTADLEGRLGGTLLRRDLHGEFH